MGCQTSTVLNPEDRRADKIDVMEFGEGDKMLTLLDVDIAWFQDLFLSYDKKHAGRLKRKQLLPFAERINPKHHRDSEDEHKERIAVCLDLLFGPDREDTKRTVDLLQFTEWLQVAMVVQFYSLKPDCGKSKLSHDQFVRFLQKLSKRDQGKHFSFQEIHAALAYADKHADQEISLSRWVQLCLALMRKHIHGNFKSKFRAKHHHKFGLKGGGHAVSHGQSSRDKLFDTFWMGHLLKFDTSDRSRRRAREHVLVKKEDYIKGRKVFEKAHKTAELRGMMKDRQRRAGSKSKMDKGRSRGRGRAEV